jgi:hypothetical protein
MVVYIGLGLAYIAKSTSFTKWKVGDLYNLRRCLDNIIRLRC